MNAIVNHLGFNPFEVKGIKLKEEIVSDNVAITYSDVRQTKYTEMFGHTYYDSVVCLPLEIKVLNYDLIKNEGNYITYLSYSFTTELNQDNKYQIYYSYSSNYVDSDIIHNFSIRFTIKLSYIVLPESLDINTTGRLFGKSDKLTF